MEQIVVIYAYCERGPSTQQALHYFLNNALPYHDHVQFVFVINGHICTVAGFPVDDQCPANVRILRRDNEGADFGGYQYAVDYLQSKNEHYDYYFFVNDSAAGPFLPPYLNASSYSWLSPFLKAFHSDPNICIVGPTINIDTTDGFIAPHVQTYAFMINAQALAHIQSMQTWRNISADKHHLIRDCEIGTSRAILERPNCEWTMTCLVPEYQAFISQYRGLKYNPNATAFEGNGDILTDGHRCFGRNVHPYEVVFSKANRNLKFVRELLPPLQKLRLLVIIPGFGNPHWDKKAEVLRGNMGVLEDSSIWDVEYIICQYTPISEQQLPSFIAERPNVTVVECPGGILGRNILNHIPPSHVNQGSYSHVMILLDDVILDKKTISWIEMLDMMEKFKLQIASPVLKDRNMSYWEYMSQPPNQITDKKLLCRVMRRCELFCYLMTSDAYKTYYAHLQHTNPWMWGMDMLLQSHFGFRVGLCQQMKMIHLFATHTQQNLDARANEMRMYLSQYGTTEDAENAKIADIAHIYDNVV